MKNFITYLSTAPVIALLSLSFIASFIIEVNRFFPDPLIFSF
uniref:Photosystem I reaction center subunit IX n=1 Tax=Ostreobium sp. HV05007bc TaxID=1940403 RepID=A0A1X9ZI76_9CHLO|nr:photosystem I reaction center subunit IX [Ostreobium sp. HV05007bc]